MPSSPKLVQGEDRVHDLPDDGGAGALPPAALVVRDDRGRDIEPDGEVGLGDLEAEPPLLERPAG
jgi:hypothetical protein